MSEYDGNFYHHTSHAVQYNVLLYLAYLVTDVSTHDLALFMAMHFPGTTYLCIFWRLFCDWDSAILKSDGLSNRFSQMNGLLLHSFREVYS